MVKMQTDVDTDVNTAIYRHKNERGITMREAHAELLRRGAEAEGLLE